MPQAERVVVVLGCGGTIAGRAGRADDHVGYRAGTLAVSDLLAGVPVPTGVTLQAEQVAQLDSKDMDAATWQRLALRIRHHLARADVAGVVVTHGTDTLEETAYFLHRIVAAPQPVVLTAAMRPASALSPDGPQNLADAVQAAADPRLAGVGVMFNGTLFAAVGLRKVHGYRIDAFQGGELGPRGVMANGVLQLAPGRPTQALHDAPALAADPAQWPWVEIVTSGAGARADVVDALVARGVHGLVLAGTGNGTLPAAWDDAIWRAVSAGVALRRASRCQLGGVVDGQADDESGRPPSVGSLTAVQARVELMLDLVASRAAA
ncbi:MAG: asparaginase [Aquabacterium sp.]